MSEAAGRTSAAAEPFAIGPDAQGGPEAPAADAGVDGALRDLSLEVVRALRQLLDLAEAVVAEPDLVAGLVRSGRGLVESALPPEALASAKQTTSQIAAVLIPPDVRRQLLATLATILTPTEAPESRGTGPGTP